MTLPVDINKETEVKALIDSGASSNFMHEETARKIGAKLTKREEPQPVKDIQGKTLGWIDSYAKVTMNIDSHKEEIKFYIIPLGIHGLVLGLPWLQKHDPEIKWSERKLRLNSSYCKQNCIKKGSRDQGTKGKGVPLAQKRLENLELEDDEIDDFTLNVLQHSPIEYHESGRNSEQKNPTECHGSGRNKEPKSPIEYHDSGKNSETMNLLKYHETRKEQKEDLQGVPVAYHDFEDVFDLQRARRMPEDRGLWNFKIEFIDGWEDKLPKTAKGYRLTQEEQRLEQETIDELLESGMISPSQSPVGAPCFFVGKKDGTKRYVVDWRGINKITIRDVHPLPIMDDLLDLAKGSRIMSKLDLTASYNQIPIREEDRWKTAFISRGTLYEFNVMHFGFVNAPAHMQRFMQHTLAPVHSELVRVYLDDIPVFSPNEKTHVETMRRVLQILRNKRLYAKAKKCEFHKKEMELLGVRVSTKGFKMEDKKVTQVREWKPPKNVKGVRSFLGFCNFYRRFIKNFSLMARPLHDLEQKNHPWRWTEKEQGAFEKLKKAVTSEPVLKHVDQSLPFRLETDASNVAYGAVLSQKEPDQPRHPVAYMSKSMTPPERNYDIGDKEALGIIKPLQHWRHWLEGTNEAIEILTDHKNLVNFSNPQILNQRQRRWLEALQRFNFIIKYRPGTRNTAADALSRRDELHPTEKPKEQILLPREVFDKLPKLEDTEQESLESVLNAMATDLTVRETIKKLLKESPEIAPPTEHWEEDLPIHQGRVWVPEEPSIKRKILQLYHDSPMAGHQGVTGTSEQVARGYYWLNMNEYISDYVGGCRTCQMAKKKSIKAHGKLRPLETPEGPWQWTESDLVGPLPPSKGKNAIYVVTDRFTKYAYFIPCTDKETAQSLAKLHERYVWSQEGLPKIHSTDRGPQFNAEFTRELYKSLGIEQRLSTAYHPQTQGQVESLNGWLETYLRMYVGHRQDDWMDHLHRAQFAWNNHHHSSIGTTPFFASKIRHPTFTDIPAKAQTQDERTRTRIDVDGLVTQMIEKAQEAQRKAYDRWKNDPPTFRKGDRVWLETTNLSTDRPSPKLDWKRIGPLTVKEQLSPLTYRLHLPTGYRIHDVFHVSLLSPVKEDKITGRTQPPPPPIQVLDPITEEPEEHYVIKRYLDSRWVKDKKEWDFQFLVEWEGYDDHTWESRRKLEQDTKETRQKLGPDDDDFDLEEEFYTKHPDAPHHDDPEAERFITEERKHRRKGKTPIRRRRN